MDELCSKVALMYGFRLIYVRTCSHNVNNARIKKVALALLSGI